MPPPVALRLRRVIAGALLLGAGWPVQAQPPGATGRPTLLVLVVVDQMRADYLTRYSAQWTGGLRRLLDEGARYEQTFYPYVNTVTCVGHATLSTGAWPKTHGIILNQWYRRDQGRVRSCTFDPSARAVVYSGRPDGEGHSATQLRVPTLAERLRRRWPDSRSVSLSLKPRSSIMMAGRDATAITWIGPGGWQTSTAFTSAPLPSISRSVAAHPIDGDRTAVWERLRDAASYLGVDDGPGERPEHGWTRQFPHPLTPPGATPATFLELWQSSPYGDAALGAMTVSAIEGFQLGQRDAVDFLGVSFSSTDLVGHDFGPDSHEVQDTLARLDRTMGTLLAALDAKVGRGQYALALSADHGVATVPEVAAAAGQSAGRVPLGVVRSTVNAALKPWGAGPPVARVEYTEVYLSEAARAQMTAARVAPALAALRAMPGVAAAIWTPNLAHASDLPPTIVAAVRAGYVPDRSGDITIVPAPNWILVPGSDSAGGAGTTHGSWHEYDQHVPLVFLGAPFAPGRYQAAATPADAAPTLAATVGLAFTGVEGRPLTASARPVAPPK